MRNLRTLLGGCGLDLPQVVSVRVYLPHFERDYHAMNAAHTGDFAAGRRRRGPASASIVADCAYEPTIVAADLNSMLDVS